MTEGETRTRPVGQSKDAGFQVGARRTYDLDPQAAWALLTSDKGLALWLGEAEGLRLEPRATYRTQEGAEGEVRVVQPGSHLRLTWRPPAWRKASTIQVRVIPSGARTTISFHQEHLYGPDEREQMRQRWLRVLAELAGLM